MWDREVQERLELHNLRTDHIMIRSELKYLIGGKVVMLKSRVLWGTPLQRFGSRLDPDPELNRAFGPVAITIAGAPSYSEGRQECPPRVWYPPENDPSTFTLHILWDTPGGFLWLKSTLLMNPCPGVNRTIRNTTFVVVTMFMQAFVFMKTPWPVSSDVQYSMVEEHLKLAIEVQDRQRALAGPPVGTPSVCQLAGGPSLKIDPETRGSLSYEFCLMLLNQSYRYWLRQKYT